MSGRMTGENKGKVKELGWDEKKKKLGELKEKNTQNWKGEKKIKAILRIG